jgi:hypothetical protein
MQIELASSHSWRKLDNGAWELSTIDFHHGNHRHIGPSHVSQARTLLGGHLSALAGRPNVNGFLGTIISGQFELLMTCIFALQARSVRLV